MLEFEDVFVEMNISKIASELNRRSKMHPIGELQQIRKQIRKLKQAPTSNIFSSSTINERWAFHHGGRTELQFNIGIETIDHIDFLRYGVAFSFQTSQTLTSIDVLIPKVRAFNEFIEYLSGSYADMRMWHYQENVRSIDYMPSILPSELVSEGVFVFLGKRQKLGELDFESILDDFDRLLPLYKSVESLGEIEPILFIEKDPFKFVAKRKKKMSTTTASYSRQELDIDLRHNILQNALMEKLTAKFGGENVGEELNSGNGTSVDIVVRHNDEFWFFEIKTAKSPRLCIRQAVGQLLEYSFWPGSQTATRLIVVGETKLDEEGAKYLKKLQDQFSLPIEYEQIVVK